MWRSAAGQEVTWACPAQIIPSPSSGALFLAELQKLLALDCCLGGVLLYCLYRIPLATLEYQSLSETMAGGKNAASVTEGMLVTYVL